MIVIPFCIVVFMLLVLSISSHEWNHMADEAFEEPKELGQYVSEGWQMTIGITRQPSQTKYEAFLFGHPEKEGELVGEGRSVEEMLADLQECEKEYD